MHHVFCKLIASGALLHLEPGPLLCEQLAAAVHERRNLYVHLDCDVLEPGRVPLEYEVAGGLTISELREGFEVLARRPVMGVEIAELKGEWRDGRPADTRALVEALAPLCG